MTYPEDIDQAVIAFNACYYCGSVSHVAMNPEDCPATTGETGSLVMRGDESGCVECGGINRHLWDCKWNIDNEERPE